jgi:hypothetical protein
MGLEVQLKWQNPCLASMKPYIQTPVPPKKSTQKQKQKTPKLACIKHFGKPSARFLSKLLTDQLIYLTYLWRQALDFCSLRK